MNRCAIFFNSDTNITELSYFNLNDYNVLVKIYKFNNDYYMIIEGKSIYIEEIIKLIENNKIISTFELISYQPIESNLLICSNFKNLDINKQDDYLYIKMIYDVKDNIRVSSELR
jgi:hypothetical protein